MTALLPSSPPQTPAGTPGDQPAAGGTSSILNRFWSKVNRTGDCWEWTGGRAWNRGGYGQFRAGKTLRAHRYSYELHFGPIPNGLCVLHHCDNTACVNPAHLFLGTNDDNIADKVAKGRSARGTGHGNARLTPELVRAIRECRCNGATYGEVARIFGLPKSTVWNVLARRTWTHVD